MRKNFLLPIALFFAILLFNFSCSSSDTAPAPNPTPTTVNVSILAMSYSPATVTVVKGTIVKWTNNGGGPHTVTADNGTTFDSSTLNVGGVFNFTTSATGTFQYHCLIHGLSMSGTLVVTN